jgi:hypothetical protein
MPPGIRLVTRREHFIVLVLRSDSTQTQTYAWVADTGLSPSQQVTELYKGHELLISGKKQSPKSFGRPVYETGHVKTYVFDVDYLPL